MRFLAAAPWLENGRVAAQSVWLCVFCAALWMTLAAFGSPRQPLFASAARWLWASAMGMLILGWLGGATLEMMRRAALVSGVQMIVALAAFSLLVAGVLSLGREWFGARFNTPLRADKIALSLVILSFAGRWFGGMALENNAWWFLTATPKVGASIPDAWALLLAGATLFGASRSVASPDESLWRARNPRLASWWLLVTALALMWPQGAGNPRAASVFLLASGMFGCKIWRARADCPRWLQVPRAVRLLGVIFLAALPLFLAGQARSQWFSEIESAWREPHQVAAWLGVAIGVFYLLGAQRQTLRLAIFGRFFDRALLHGTLAGWILATLLFGPGGGLFWAFWPLCGAFFDLLLPRETFRFSSDSHLAAELRADELAAACAAP